MDERRSRPRPDSVRARRRAHRTGARRGGYRRHRTALVLIAERGYGVRRLPPVSTMATFRSIQGLNWAIGIDPSRSERRRRGPKLIEPQSALAVIPNGGGLPGTSLASRPPAGPRRYGQEGVVRRRREGSPGGRAAAPSQPPVAAAPRVSFAA